MKIERIEAIPLSIPFTAGVTPKGFGKASWDRLDMVVVQIETDDGNIGWGEAFSYNCRSAVVAAIHDMLTPMLIGRDARDIAGIHRDMQVAQHLWGRYGITMFAISGIDIALWDLLGKAADMPLCRMLGAPGHAPIPCYASLLKYNDADVVVDRCKAAIDAGYRNIKLHEKAVPEVRAAREALGPGIPMMLDVNCVWSPEEAAHIIDPLSAFNLHWLEEPVWPPENFTALASLRRRFDVPIASGENLCTSWQFAEMFRAEAVDYAQPSVTKVGGVTEFRKILALAETANVTVAPHAPYFGPGFLATLHLTAAMAPGTLFERFFCAPEATLYGDALDPQDGFLSTPLGPGLGIEPDLEVIADYRAG